MIPLKKVLKNDRLMHALTGMSAHEFTSLAPEFEQKLSQLRQNAYTCDPDRIRKPGGGKKGFLKTPADKLFFILFYYKCYPTYDVAGFLYGCDRSAACRRQQQLSVLLEKTLKRKHVLPRRRLSSVEDFLAAFPEAREVFLDGTERPIQRPQDAEQQTTNYSGKKKRHTRKNIIISTRKKRIGLLSRTREGKAADIQIARAYAPPRVIPEGVTVHADLGFKGLDAPYPGLRVSMPERKPRTRDLTDAQRRRNAKKSRARVLVEHAIGGVKRLGIVSQVFRNKKEGFDDTAMLVSCGLWNYHLAMR
jgi:hypothetical protein